MCGEKLRHHRVTISKGITPRVVGLGLMAKAVVVRDTFDSYVYKGGVGLTYFPKLSTIQNEWFSEWFVPNKLYPSGKIRNLKNDEVFNYVFQGQTLLCR